MSVRLNKVTKEFNIGHDSNEGVGISFPIPEDILKVERPKNTIVIAYGKDKKLYAVRERIGCKYVNGRRLPINGSTVGHIVNHLYMPIGDEEPKPVSQACIDLKNWANAELCDQLFRDIQP